MARIQCFLLEPTEQVRVSLRRYRSYMADSCPLDPSIYSYHQTFQFLCEEPVEVDEKGQHCNGLKPLLPHDDSRWPQKCACGYEFQEEDTWQRFTDAIYVRKDTGERMTLRDAPAGAMWYAWWMDDFQIPQGEHNLVVKTPGGEWNIDSQALNCTMPDDLKQEKHHCWVRSGIPPIVTVGKDGPTCHAGTGSIQCGRYHGFLRNGYLEE